MSYSQHPRGGSTTANDFSPKILHVMHFDKFISPFVDFVEDHFEDFERHIFFCFGEEHRFPVRRRTNTKFESDFRTPRQAYLDLVRQMNMSHKIIFHGLFNHRVIRLLAVQPWLFRKSYWVIWGGDLYRSRHSERNWNSCVQEVFRRFVIRRIGHLVSATDGDIGLARKWYRANGQHHDCFVYTSNLYKELPIPSKFDEPTQILLGNSADPDNEHFEALRILEPHKDADIRIYAPLSYGDPNHALAVAVAGTKLFGKKFIALMDFMPLDSYLELLAKIDIAVFNHRRQQGVGNIVTLLGLGKKVYLRSDTTTWGMLNSIGVQIYDTVNFDLQPIDTLTMEQNRMAIREHFSEGTLVNQLTHLFGTHSGN